MTGQPIANKTANKAVLDTMHAAFAARAMYVIAEFGVADLLADGPRSATELAAKLGVQPIPLHQILRTVASYGLLRTERDDEIGPRQRYALTETGHTLREDHPSGTRDLVRTMQGPTFWTCLEVLPDRVTTGRTGPEISHGAPFFELLDERPEEASRFYRMMTATHGNEPQAVNAAYDLSWAGHVVDVGGGIGTLLLGWLQRHAHLSGELFELPSALPRARAHIAERGMAHRCAVRTGDFFHTVPAGADAYVLSRILHDWDDESCVTILRSCAAAMSERSRLLIIEKVLPDNDEPHLGKLLDLVMLTVTSGRERTAAEYHQLLARSGLRPRRLVPTESASSVIEAELASDQAASTPDRKEDHHE